MGISSQIFFCSIPIRLDSYNSCQFSCDYCFAKARGGYRSDLPLKGASADALRTRLERVQSGVINSALDEMLANRIPVQLGGMSDPFMPAEEQHGVTLNILRILKDFDYPTVISTKGSLAAKSPYLEILADMNAYVRFSIVGANLEGRFKIEKGSPTLDESLECIKTLSYRGIPVAVRIQPIIPGHEESVIDIIAQSAKVGARHVSFEYLKIPVEKNSKQSAKLDIFMNSEIHRYYLVRGASKIGREYVLPPTLKLPFLRAFKEYGNKLGMTVGLADNEFLPFGDGDGCCSGSEIYLRRCNMFLATPSALVRSKKMGDLLRFSDLEAWMPIGDVGTYLNSNSRLQAKGWRAYLEKIWSSDQAYSPGYFYGVSRLSEVDEQGRAIYKKDIDII